MMEIIVLRFDAPLMSFGGPIVDNYGFTQNFPAASMLAGLIANSLGLDHKESDSIQRIQERLRFAARLDRTGTPIVDYQTVDLGQEFMCDTGWTTRGERERRKGGGAGQMTHIRYRYYLAGAISTVVLTLNPADEEPSLGVIYEALREPVRPLFIGRKNCLPASLILLDRFHDTSLVHALSVTGVEASVKVPAQWPYEEEIKEESMVVSIVDEKDWKNQIHCGERLVRRGIIELKGGADA